MLGAPTWVTEVNPQNNLRERYQQTQISTRRNQIPAKGNHLLEARLELDPYLIPLKPSAGVILWSHGPVATDQGDGDWVWVNPKAIIFEGKQILETLLTPKSLAEKERKQMQSIHYRYTKYLSAGKVFLESFKIFIYSNYQIIVFLFKRILGILYTYKER